ncbi:TPA: right-handed parallel beta-helix repeat-containing protein [Escherichia coli]|nr:right-handed parallel beta-helix repeat-containing protein [Escherichia coli]
MTDITANVIVSMPSQLFTMARSFKAVANGKIYIGKIDTDPVNPENQIQVYVENEDGSHVSVSQPIIINAAGYPVYNGQIAKFVTVQGHSMAVYDAYGTQQFYYPNVLKYDPDQLRQELGGYDGAKVIGECPDIETLRTIEPQENSQRIIVRHHTLNSGYGGGQFRSRLDGSSYTDNNGTVIKTTGGAVWLRINADIINPLMFGAIPDGVTDCSSAFTNALSAGSIVVPDGEFKISNVQVPTKTSIRGNGYKSKIVVPTGQASFLVGNSSAATTIDYFDGCNISDLHIWSDSVATGTIGIITNGISSSRFENIVYTKTNIVIRQDHAEGCQFINISNSDLEDVATDPVFVIFSQISKRSNDNTYRNFIARSKDTEIHLGMVSGGDVNVAQHDGITIEDCILFPCQKDNIYVANGRMGRISNNELFAAGRNGIRIDAVVTNMSITGNNIAWSGRFTAGGADAILVQTVAGSASSAYGQVDISNNIISMPSGCGMRVARIGQVTITNNTIVSPNNIKTTVTGPFTAKQYDGIRINGACGYVLVEGNNVTTGRHGQGGDDFSTNWRYDVYVEDGVINGTVSHPGINVLSLSPYIEIITPVCKYMRGRHQIEQKEVNSPYATTNWNVASGSGTVTTASATNPYSGELSNVVLQFSNTTGTSVFTQGQNVSVAGNPLGAVFKVRCTSPASAWVTFSIRVDGSTFVQKSMMVGAGWGEVDLRRLGAPSGVIAFQISTSDVCTIQIAELRVTRTSEAPQTSGTYYGTTSPVVGFFKKGDVVKNSAPATGSPRGWVCTASGTPGSWVSEGNL